MGPREAALADQVQGQAATESHRGSDWGGGQGILFHGAR
jgi:hypothetical protein